MSKMIRVLIFSVFILSLIGCSSVGSPGKAKIKKPTKVKVVSDSLNSSNQDITQRFSDTTTIVLPVINTKEKEQNHQKAQYTNSKNKTYEYLQRAIINFDEGKEQDKSCELFKSIVETYMQNDSIYYEAKYYTAECCITRNEVREAKRILEVLYPDNNVPNDIKERVIVRLGQIYCLLNNPSLSQKFFNELKKLNPKSIYLKVANCNFTK
jgi:hypothetical protein